MRQGSVNKSKINNTQDCCRTDLWKIDVQDQRIEHVFERDTQPIAFLFHSWTLQIEELSPFSQRALIYVGPQVLVFDYLADAVVLECPIDGPVEAVWWVDADTCLLCIEDPDGNDRFLQLSVVTGETLDVTSSLLSHWKRQSYDPNWYRSALP